MKYIITESQYKSLKESTIPPYIRRRASEETLRHHISSSELEYPAPCGNFEDGYDYADNVIEDAINEFVGEIYGNIYEEDYYSDVMDYLRTLCRDLFGEDLVTFYDDTCAE